MSKTNKNKNKNNKRLPLDTQQSINYYVDEKIDGYTQNTNKPNKNATASSIKQKLANEVATIRIIYKLHRSTPQNILNSIAKLDHSKEIKSIVESYDRNEGNKKSILSYISRIM